MYRQSLSRALVMGNTHNYQAILVKNQNLPRWKNDKQQQVMVLEIIDGRIEKKGTSHVALHGMESCCVTVSKVATDENKSQEGVCFGLGVQNR
jgi:hypothetical protein